MNYKLTTTAYANHPTEALATLGDIAQFLDELADSFCDKGFIKPEDLPIYIRYLNTQDLTPNTRPTNTATLVIQEDPPPQNQYDTLRNTPAHPLGSMVRSWHTGHPFTVRASAYHNLNQQYNYLLVSRVTGQTEIINHTTLITEHQFHRFHDKLQSLSQAPWDFDIPSGMFISRNNKHRKLRLEDIQRIWTARQNNDEEIPF